MAVYFDHKIQAPNVGIQTDIAWHSSYPLLAVASKNELGVGGSVNLYLDEVGLLLHQANYPNKTKQTIAPPDIGTTKGTPLYIFWYQWLSYVFMVLTQNCAYLHQMCFFIV